MNDLTQNRWQQIDMLFAKVLEKPSQERNLFLKQTCGPDTDLLNHVEKLLRVHDEAQKILGNSASVFAAPLIPGLIEEVSDNQQEKQGTKIGPYEILEEIGRGGMGSVYLVKNEGAPYQKKVALKLIRPGMDTEDVLRRFRNEGQILASLEHPNIARLYDGGVHTDGRPYFVMERIKGEPIDVYCDKHNLPIEDRIRLFKTVCEAVHFAHQSLIVHRDLKPAHVLVTANGEVKLVDFGIAKLLEPEQLQLKNHHTQTGVKVMTPEFAAPEQVRGESVTTASDIYSLGVLLYYLLTGRKPYRLKTTSMLDIERIVCQTEPILPSEAVAGTEIPGISQTEEESIDPELTARLRGKNIDNLKRKLSGDLDQIVLMALRKESERRYRSALALAEDLENYLQAKPILARPATLRYRIRKFVNRNRWAVSAAAVAIISILTGFGMALWQANAAKTERDIAQHEAAKAQATQDYLVGLFEAADPTENQGEQLTAKQIVQRGIDRLEQDFGDEPEVHAEMLKVLGRVEQALGDFDLSAQLLEEALIMTRELRGENHIDVATVAVMLAEVVRWDGELDRAETLFREALTIRRSHNDGDNAETALNMDRLARTLELQGNLEEAEAQYREALAIRDRLFGENSLAVASNLNNLGWLLHEMGKENEAEEFLKRSLKIREQNLESPHPAIASTMSNLSMVLRSKGNYDDAENYAVQALEQEQAIYGDDHPRVTTALSNRATILIDMALYKEAAEQYRKILENNRRQLGPDHIYVGIALGHLSTSLIQDGRSEEALPLIDDMLKIFGNAVGKEHRFYAKGLVIRGDALTWQHPDQAVAVLEQSVYIFRRTVGHNHPDLAAALTQFGRAQLATGETGAAEITLREALDIQRQALPAPHTDTIWTLINLGRVLMAQNQTEEAELFLHEAVEASVDALPPGHWRQIAAELELAVCLRAKGALIVSKEKLEKVLNKLQGRTDFHAARLQARAKNIGI